MYKRLFLLLITISCACLNTSQAQIKILFDATKAETAGSADWVIDQDVSKTAQRLPTPDQSTVTSSTAETYWTGGLSNWGIDCVNKGYYVETLPSNGGKITYGNKTNAQDLSNYTVFVVCEPNIRFSAIEKTAILNFVANGGGLFMISDHTGSDRNNDGWDSPAIWNDLLSNNSTTPNPFGIKFDLVNFSGIYSNRAASLSANDSLLHGSYGNPTTIKWSNGTTMTISPDSNATAKAVFYKSGTNGNTNVMWAYARYGLGRVVAAGDSSPFDDGTGATGLYNGYTRDASGNHQLLIMNSTIWLATLPSGLPIKFTDITGSNSNNSTIIRWQTNQSSSQTNSYQIERSANGKDFTTVATVISASKSGIVSYQWTINETITSNVYYRAKYVDKGEVVYSSVVIIKPTIARSINIYPNPISANTGSNFTVSGLIFGSTITITNMKGVKYFESKSVNSSVSFNTNNLGGQRLSQGIYLVTVKELSGITTTSKLVVGK